MQREKLFQNLQNFFNKSTITIRRVQHSFQTSVNMLGQNFITVERLNYLLNVLNYSYR